MAILLMLEHRSRRSGTCSCAASACKCACSRALGAGAHRPWKHQPSRPLQCPGRPARAACVSARRALSIMEYHIIDVLGGFLEGALEGTRNSCCFLEGLQGVESKGRIQGVPKGVLAGAPLLPTTPPSLPGLHTLFLRAVDGARAAGCAGGGVSGD